MRTLDQILESERKNREYHKTYQKSTKHREQQKMYHKTRNEGFKLIRLYREERITKEEMEVGLMRLEKMYESWKESHK